MGQEWLPGGRGPEPGGEGQHSRACPNMGLRLSLFLAQLRVPDPGQEDSSWGLSLPSPPNPALSGNKEVGNGAQGSAVGQPASALFLEALRAGDSSSSHPNPAAEKPFLACPPNLSCCHELSGMYPVFRALSQVPGVRG